MDRVLYKLRGLKASIGALNFRRRPGVIRLFWPLVLDDVYIYINVFGRWLWGNMAYVRMCDILYVSVYCCHHRHPVMFVR